MEIVVKSNIIVAKNSGIAVKSNGIVAQNSGIVLTK